MEKTMEWRTDIENAPKDGTPFVGYCNHESEPYVASENKLTTYGAHAEFFGHAKNGPQILVWGGAYDEDDGHIPDLFFVANSEWDKVANPVAWMPLPPPPTVGS
jgi:hypothetical protein